MIGRYALPSGGVAGAGAPPEPRPRPRSVFCNSPVYIRINTSFLYTYIAYIDSFFSSFAKTGDIRQQKTSSLSCQMSMLLCRPPRVACLALFGFLAGPGSAGLSQGAGGIRPERVNVAKRGRNAPAHGMHPLRSPRTRRRHAVASARKRQSTWHTPSAACSEWALHQAFVRLGTSV